ncbi:MAG: right-handed parallel beta-helix repeat-containing protein [Candidatus Sigynarchaeum springense]
MVIFIIVTSILVIGFISPSTSVHFTSSRSTGTPRDTFFECNAGISPRDAINAFVFIDGNAALDTYCAGNGTDGLTPATAHVIRDLVLNASSIANGNGVVIHNTDRYLIICNCTVIGAHRSGQFTGINIPGIGIWLWNSIHVNVTNCSLINNDGGLCLTDGCKNVVSENLILNNGGGLSIRNSDENVVIGNKFSGNNGGIVLSSSRYNLISDNSIINTSASIVDDDGAVALFEADSNSIINNNVSNNLGNGIYLFESRGNTIADNIVTGNAGACIKLVWFPWKWDHYFIVLNDIHGNVGCSDPQWSEPIASWSTIGIIAAAIACCALVCRHLKRGTAPGTRPSLIRTPDQASC